jgi:SAM-dependent methyltransferase
LRINRLDSEKNKISFSDYVETYQGEVQQSIDFIGQDLDFYIELKANLIVKIAQKYFSSPKSINILDIGSGIGLTDCHLSQFFNNLHGVDVEEEVVQKAAIYNPRVKYCTYDGLDLPFENNSLDMVFAINVMHHIHPDKWENFVKEMYRVVKPGGISAVFEHNPLNPLTRLAVSRCEFDRDAVLIYKNNLKKKFIASGFKITQGAYIVFFPFRGNVFRSTEKFLSRLPLGAQYFLIGKK